MNTKRFLKNPKHSFIKLWRIFHTWVYVKRINRKIDSVRKNTQASEDLDALFIDKRENLDTDIDKIKHIALKILMMVDHLSEKHGFNYFLAYGTLLGAVRHDGYIPWDDDIDIMMTRTDLNKLIAVSNELPDSINFFAHGLDFVKVMDKYSKMSIDGDRGVAVDIFILEDKKDALYSFVNVHSLRRLSFKESYFLPIVKKQFEAETLPIPCEWDKILTSIYGNYMELPPVEKRVSLHVNSTSINISPFPK